MKNQFIYIGLLAIILISLFMLPGCDILNSDDGNDPNTSEVGDTLWIQDIQREKYFISGNSLALSTDQESFYYAEAGGTLYWTAAEIVARNTATGALKWKSEPLDNIGLSSQIVVGDNGMVYVIGSYKLYSINPSDGATNWTWEVPTELPNPDNPQSNVYTYGQIGALALTNEGNLILGSVGSGVYSRGIYCISSSGTKLWHNLKANGGAVQSGIVIGKNDIAYYYTQLGQAPEDLVALDAKTGSIKWTLDVSYVSSSENNIIIDTDGSLICSFQKTGDSERKLHRVDPATGDILWTSTASSDIGRKLMDKGGQVCLWFQFEGGINVFNMSNGSRQQFSQNLNAQRIAAINDLNQMVTVNSTTGAGKLTIYDADGSIDWDVEVAGLVNDVMLITDDGVIIGQINLHGGSYLPSKLVAIQGEARLARTGWPRVSHDNRNTSNWSK